ncbi:hypothetical protein YC2023_095673 [Brassica napus]
MKPNGKSPVTSDHDEKIMLFRDVTPGPHETQLRFRLIHFWEAWNPLKKTLIGLEMLLIDEQPGSLYKLNNFYGSGNKTVYRVSDHAVTVSFSWNSELSVLEDSPTPFDEDRFRFHSFEDFQASCDRKGDLYVTESSGGNYNPATSEETFETGTNVCEASKISVDSAEGSKRNGDIDEMGKAKRLKRGV